MFEQAKKRIHKNYARAVIRKYVTIFLLDRKEKREWLDFHGIYHLNEIIYLQTKWRAFKQRPKKLDVKRFKEVFYGVLIGWRIRRILSYMKSLPDIKEAVDFVKLRTDLDSNSSDMFSLQIISQFPQKIAVFQNKFYDLYENAVWIKKPNLKQSNNKRKPFIKANSKKQTKPVPQAKIINGK